VALGDLTLEASGAGSIRWALVTRRGPWVQQALRAGCPTSIPASNEPREPRASCSEHLDSGDPVRAAAVSRRSASGGRHGRCSRGATPHGYQYALGGLWGGGRRPAGYGRRTAAPSSELPLDPSLEACNLHSGYHRQPTVCDAWSLRGWLTFRGFWLTSRMPTEARGQAGDDRRAARNRQRATKDSVPVVGRPVGHTQVRPLLRNTPRGGVPPGSTKEDYSALPFVAAETPVALRSQPCVRAVGRRPNRLRFPRSDRYATATPISARKRDGSFGHPKYWSAYVSVRLSSARVIATKQLRRSSRISSLSFPLFRAAQLGSSSSTSPTRKTCLNSMPLDA